MGNESSASSERSDGKSSLGHFNDKPTFGQAFKAAHTAGGPGHTFTYKDKLYSTNCEDGGDYRYKPDNREPGTHKLQEKVHQINAVLKEKTGTHVLDKISIEGTHGQAKLTDKEKNTTELKLKNKPTSPIPERNDYLFWYNI